MGGAVGMNEIGWVECVNYKEKRAEVETMETTEKKVSSGNHSAPNSQVLFARSCGVLPCVCVS